MNPDALDLALLLARLALGGMLAAHGLRKLQSIDGTARWFHGMGMRPGRMNAVLAGLTETGAGALMAVGLLTTLSATAFVALMVVAAITTHARNGFFILDEGWEYVFIIAVFAIVVATVGPGDWSLDEAIGLADDLDGRTGLLIATVGGVAGGIGQLAMFYRPSAAASEAT
jgi:putative oxidoreductase